MRSLAEHAAPAPLRTLGHLTLARMAEGVVILNAEGASPQHCPRTKFTKPQGKQELLVNFGPCLSGAEAEAQYCSDQGTVLVHVSVPNKHVPKVPVTLKVAPCPEKRARAGNISGVHSKRVLTMEEVLAHAARDMGMHIDENALALIRGETAEDFEATDQEAEPTSMVEAQD